MKNQATSAMPAELRFQAPPKQAVPPTIDSHQLLGSGRECWITHAGQTYRLCHTRNDKLILTK